MVGRAFDHFDPKGMELLLIEKVRQSGLPHRFDLGESCGWCSLSSRKGKINAQIPALFKSADVVVIHQVICRSGGLQSRRRPTQLAGGGQQARRRFRSTRPAVASALSLNALAQHQRQ